MIPSCETCAKWPMLVSSVTVEEVLESSLSNMSMSCHVLQRYYNGEKLEDREGGSQFVFQNRARVRPV